MVATWVDSGCAAVTVAVRAVVAMEEVGIGGGTGGGDGGNGAVGVKRCEDLLRLRGERVAQARARAGWLHHGGQHRGRARRRHAALGRTQPSHGEAHVRVVSARGWHLRTQNAEVPCCVDFGQHRSDASALSPWASLDCDCRLGLHWIVTDKACAAARGW